MNREMHKKERPVSDERAKENAPGSDRRNLAMHGDDGYPYALPMNYVYLNGAIYIHTADYGYKIDALKANQKSAFLSSSVPKSRRSFIRPGMKV